MKNPLANIKGKFGEVKGRTLLLVVVVVVVFIIAAVFSLRKGENPVLGGTTTNSRTATVKAPNIESTPGVGNVNDTAYIELQQQANQQKAETAIQKGTSAVATVTNNQFVPELSIPEPGMASIPGGVANTPAETAAVAAAKQNAALEQYQKVYEEQMILEQEREQQRAREQEIQQEEAYMDAFEGLMQAQIKGLIGQWKPPSQTYVHTEPENNQGGTPPSTSNPGLPPMYKAGDIIFGVMETSINSDEPGPVMAQVVSGPLAGAKLLGSFRRVDDQVFIEFTLLSSPAVANSIPVKAVAIDPETARTALATSVDHHRLLRYSTLFASAFLQGMGDAVLAGIQPDFTLEGDNTLTVNSVSVGTRDQVIVGLGEVGRKAGEKLDPLFDKPPTVTVDSGTAVGLMFLQDFSLQPGSPPVQVVDTTAPVQAYPSATSYAPLPSTPVSAGTPVNAISQPTNTVNTQ